LISRLSISLEKVKSGLFKGVLARFYEWKGAPPDDVNHLTSVAESVFVNLNHIWLNKPHEKVKSEKYIVEFSGFLEVVEEGLYRLHVVANGGVKLWIDESLTISSWNPNRLQKLASLPLPLRKGFHRLRLLYCNAQRLGEIRVSWEKQEGMLEEIPREALYFSLGEHVFITNIPDYYVTVLTPIESPVPVEVKKCMGINNMCTIELKYNEQPFKCLVSIYDDKNQLVYRTQHPLLMWGGDVYELRFSLG